MSARSRNQQGRQVPNHPPARTDHGRTITEEELAVMLKQYYLLHGWSEEGIPPG